MQSLRVASHSARWTSVLQDGMISSTSWFWYTLPLANCRVATESGPPQRMRDFFNKYHLDNKILDQLQLDYHSHLECERELNPELPASILPDPSDTYPSPLCLTNDHYWSLNDRIRPVSYLFWSTASAVRVVPKGPTNQMPKLVNLGDFLKPKILHWLLQLSLCVCSQLALQLAVDCLTIQR